MSTSSPGSADACLLPQGILEDLRDQSRAEVITVYLSNPAAPYDRASYVLVGQLGVHASYQPFMWGPLPPRSLRLFSATDHHKVRLIEDVTRTPHFKDRAFTRRHAIRALARLSVRLPVAASDGDRPEEPDPMPGLLPPFVEVFLNYQSPRSEAELAEGARRGREALLRRAHEILVHPTLQRLLSLRSVGVRFRKLQRIVNRFGNASEPTFRTVSDRIRVRRAISECYDGLDDFLRYELTTGQAGSPDPKIAISVHMVERWGDDFAECETYPVHGHPGGVQSRLDLELRRNPNRGLCRYVAHHGQSVVVADMARAPREIAEAFIHVGISGASITFPVLSGDRVIGVVNIESTNGEIVVAAQAVWQVLPAIEALLRDAMRLQAQADESSTRYVLKTFATLRPRREAIQYRLDTLCQVLEVRECALLLGTGAQLEVFSAKAAAKPSVLVGPRLYDRLITPMLSSAARAGGAYAASVCLANSNGRPTLLSAHTYRRDHGSRQDLLRQPASAEANDIAEALRLDGTADVVEIIAVPIHRLRQEARDDQPIGSLIVVSDDGRPRVTHSWLHGLIEIGSSLQMVLNGIESLESERDLFSWATAGLGSIHDIVGAVGRAVDALDNEVGDPHETARLLEAIRDQLLLLGSLARNETNEPNVGDFVDFSVLVRSMVEQSARLVGHRSQDCVVEVENTTDRVRFGGGQMRNALCHILGNAFKYGGTGTAPRIHASLRDGTLSIVVRNRAYQATFGEALRQAIEVIDDVNRGNSVEALRRILRRRDRTQMKGIGTWLTARIAKDVLHGSYHLSCQPFDGEQLEVVARVVFQAQ